MLYAFAKESPKVLTAFTLLAVIQAALGVVLIVLARNAREDAFQGEVRPCELTHHPHIASFLLPTGLRLVCIRDSQATFDIPGSLFFFLLSLRLGRIYSEPISTPLNP
jgi:hypothetical protein